MLGSLKCDCREQLDAALETDRRRGHGRRRLPAPRGPRHRPGQQDPRLRPAEQRRRHRRGQPGPGLRGRRPQLRHRRRDPGRPGREVGAPDDQQPAQGARACEAAGVAVTERVSHWVGENQHNAGYLAVKRRKMGHHPDTLARLRAVGQLPSRVPSQSIRAKPPHRPRQQPRSPPFPPSKMSAPSCRQVKDPALQIDFVTAGHGQGRRASTARGVARSTIELTTPACPSQGRDRASRSRRRWAGCPA